jgi:transcriptional regulator with XRE-family HTH domain
MALDGGETPAEFVRRRRLQAGLTQEQLAERAGLTADTVGALERGLRRRLYPHTARALADALGLTGAAREELAELAGGPRRGEAARPMAHATQPPRRTRRLSVCRRRSPASSAASGK